MTNKLTVKTNNQPRPILWGIDLTESELKNFDYLPDVELEHFFRYKGELYHTGEFMAIDTGRESLPPEFKAWHGYCSDSFFSGLLIRYSEDFEQVIVGTYYS